MLVSSATIAVDSCEIVKVKANKSIDRIWVTLEDGTELHFPYYIGSLITHAIDLDIKDYGDIK